MVVKKFPIKLAMIATVVLAANCASANPQIRVVGSSTVYPFTTVVAEHFGKTGSYNTPIVESTGTGGGFKLFCSGVGEGFPDMTNASRAIKESEKALCAQNGVKEITEITIGYDGLVLANNMKAPLFKLTKEQIFLALAKTVPQKDGKLIANPYMKWNQIDASLPVEPIEVYGPPPTSGTRDAFVELVMVPACEKLEAYKKAYPDEATRQKACQMVREDGKFIEAGENDNLIVQKLKNNPHALGIFGYSFLEQNEDTIQGSIIDGIEPNFDNIAEGTYTVSRPLFVYVKNAHLDKTKGLKEFAKEFVSDKAISEDGYLIDKGLIPLTTEELLAQQKKFQ